jgi:hypothetical protein
MVYSHLSWPTQYHLHSELVSRAGIISPNTACDRHHTFLNSVTFRFEELFKFRLRASRRFYFAFAMIPVLVIVVAIVYAVRRNVDGIKDRCIKMMLTAVFLSYAFVSQVHWPPSCCHGLCAVQILHDREICAQTMFQGFSCVQLDDDESWLQVDFQISCEDDSYVRGRPSHTRLTRQHDGCVDAHFQVAFWVLGVVGVLSVPIGIPVMTLLVLLKNTAGIRKRGDAFTRYEVRSHRISFAGGQP